MSGVPGQGRRFDVEEALRAATLQFWEHGYEATPVSALTAAMRINPPSFYKAFGSKEELFFRVVERYQENHDFTAAVFEEEDEILPLVRRLLTTAAETYPRGRQPAGCLILSATVTVGTANKHVGERLAEIRRGPVTEIGRRVRSGITAGTVSPTTDADATARFVGACIQGMSQQARDGADRPALRGVAEVAIRALETELRP